MKKEFFCGCDVGSTYAKCVILDQEGKIVSSSIVRTKLDPEETAKLAIQEAIKDNKNISELNDFDYMIGTGYGRNKVPFADENVSEITCHAMGVHVTDKSIRTIVDIGGQDVKSISVDTDGSVKSFVMNDKCAAGTGRFFESMANAFEMDLDEFSNLSLKSKVPIPITSQCSVFAESEVISLVAEKKSKHDIAAGIQKSVAKRCYTILRGVGLQENVTMTGGCAKNKGLKKALEKYISVKVKDLKTDPQLMGALGAAEIARKKGLSKKLDTKKIS